MNENKNQQNTVNPGKEENLISSDHIMRYKCPVFSKNSQDIKKLECMAHQREQ